MKFDFDSLIAGLRLLDFRNLIRGHRLHVPKDVARSLAIDERRAQEILEAGQTAGFLEIFSEKPRRYRVTQLGRRLAAAKAIPRISREKAEAIVARIPARLAEVNAITEFVYVIERVRIFGSNLEGTPDLGDIDCIVSLALKPEWNGEVAEANMARATASGLCFSNYTEELSFGETEVLRMFKRLSRSMSLHSDIPGSFRDIKTLKVYPKEE